MNGLTFSTPVAARWWMTAFLIAIAFSVAAPRFFPGALPWPDDLPRQTQAALRLFTGIVIGMSLQAAWWAARRVTQRRSR